VPARARAGRSIATRRLEAGREQVGGERPAARDHRRARAFGLARDESGQLVQGVIYFLRVRAGGQVRTLTLVHRR
jgi:hypothetical protein